MTDHEDPELSALRARRLAKLEQVAAAAKGPVTLTDASFDAFVAKHHTVVVDCWAPWCPPCRAMSPIIDELASKWAGKVTFGKLNTDENQGTAGRFGITSIPTLLIFRDGEFADQVVGLPPKAQLVRMLSPLAA
jgi:thioredoxin 1